MKNKENKNTLHKSVFYSFQINMMMNSIRYNKILLANPTIINDIDKTSICYK